MQHEPICTKDLSFYIWVTVSLFLVPAASRYYIRHEPMVENIEPADSYGVTHFPINSLNMTFKFFANQKSDYAYPDKKPKNAAGVQKGPEGAAAFAAAEVVDVVRGAAAFSAVANVVDTGLSAWLLVFINEKSHY